MQRQIDVFSLQLDTHRAHHTLNMIFSANVHQSIVDELENRRAPEGIFVFYVNRLEDNLSSACVSLSRLRWNKREERVRGDRLGGGGGGEGGGEGISGGILCL